MQHLARLSSSSTAGPSGRAQSGSAWRRGAGGCQQQQRLISARAAEDAPSGGGSSRDERRRASSSSSTGDSGGRGKGRKARQPGLYEVEIITPPPQSLGIHPLPAGTHNGDRIEVEGEDYIVSAVVLQYKLVRGRYQREHSRLEVMRLNRHLTNIMLEHILTRSG